MSVVFHIISSLNRGGRERQLAGILNYPSEATINKSIVFNRSENSYVEEYDLRDKVIYLKEIDPFKRLIEIYKIVA